MICKQSSLSALCLAILALSTCMCGAASKKSPPDKISESSSLFPDDSPALPQSQQMLYATGEGAVADAEEQPNRAKAYLQAKAYAKMQAIATLLETAKGTIIDLSSKGENFKADTKIKQEIKGVLDSVEVVAVTKRYVGKDTIVAVTVRAPKPTPTDLSKPAKVLPPTWLRETSDAEQAPAGIPGAYTSVIIDAQGLEISRCMSPKILRPDGTEIWGTVKSDYDFISDYGIVAYAKTRVEAMSSVRAGSNPLILRALARGDAASNGDVVLSYNDADMLERANQQAKFLEDFRVIVVVGSRVPQKVMRRSSIEPGERRILWSITVRRRH